MPRRLALLATLSLFVAFGSTPLAGEQLVVGAADFHSRIPEGHVFDSVAGLIGGALTTGGGCLVASAPLPHRAQVKQLILQVYDNHAAQDFRIELKRKRRGNSVVAQTLAGASTSGATTAAREINVVLPDGGHLVSDAFVYYLSTDADCLDGTSHRIHAVRIDYVLPLFADDFESGDTSAWGAPPQTLHHYWVSGIDFKNLQGWPWTIDTTLATFWLENAINSPAPCALARLELPHGATVGGILANLWDVRSDRNLTLSLRRSTMASAVVPAVLTSVSTSGQNGWQLQLSFTVANAVIDNDTYWYWLDACITGGNQVESAQLGVQAVQVFYSPP